MGQERITQPTVFYGPISALGGIFPPVGFGAGLSSSFSAFFKSWSLTGDGITTNFSIYTDEIILPYSENFIVTVDGVFQPPSFYTIDSYYKQIQFTNPIPNSSVANVVQIATIDDSQRFSYSFNTWTFIPTAATTTFTLCANPTTFSPFQESYIVSLDGVIQCPNTDFSVDYFDQKLNFTTAVPSGVLVRVQQIGALSAGNATFNYYITGTSGNYLPLSGGTIIGNVNVFGSLSATASVLIGTNVAPITSNIFLIKGGNIRVDGADLSNVPNITAFDTDGQSLFDLRSVSASANYNISIASSGVNNFLKFFGGRSGDEKPFIAVKTGTPIRFSSYANFFGLNYREHMRVGGNGNVGIGINHPYVSGVYDADPIAKLTVNGAISATGIASVSGIRIVSGAVFPVTTLSNLVSALAINVNNTTLYVPLLSAI